MQLLRTICSKHAKYLALIFESDFGSISGFWWFWTWHACCGASAQNTLSVPKTISTCFLCFNAFGLVGLAQNTLSIPARFFDSLGRGFWLFWRLCGSCSKHAKYYDSVFECNFGSPPGFWRLCLTQTGFGLTGFWLESILDLARFRLGSISARLDFGQARFWAGFWLGLDFG
jgi:hypothetical protein